MIEKSSQPWQPVFYVTSENKSQPQQPVQPVFYCASEKKSDNHDNQFHYVASEKNKS